MPILNGKAVLYSFVATPEVRIGVAFGSGSQSLPATELPGVSSWLVSFHLNLRYLVILAIRTTELGAVITLHKY